MSRFHRMVYVEWDDPFTSSYKKSQEAQVRSGEIDITKRESCGFVVFDTAKFLVLTPTRGSYENGDVASLLYICKHDITKLKEIHRG